MLWAAENGRLDIVKEIIQTNAGLIHVRDNDGYTPLHRASYNDHTEIVKVMNDVKERVDSLLSFQNKLSLKVKYSKLLIFKNEEKTVSCMIIS